RGVGSMKLKVFQQDFIRPKAYVNEINEFCETVNVVNTESMLLQIPHPLGGIPASIVKVHIWYEDIDKSKRIRFDATTSTLTVEKFKAGVKVLKEQHNPDRSLSVWYEDV